MLQKVKNAVKTMWIELEKAYFPGIDEVGDSIKFEVINSREIAAKNISEVKFNGNGFAKKVTLGLLKFASVETIENAVCEEIKVRLDFGLQDAGVNPYIRRNQRFFEVYPGNWKELALRELGRFAKIKFWFLERILGVNMKKLVMHKIATRIEIKMVENEVAIKFHAADEVNIGWSLNLFGKIWTFIEGWKDARENARLKRELKRFKIRPLYSWKERAKKIYDFFFVLDDSVYYRY